MFVLALVASLATVAGLLYTLSEAFTPSFVATPVAPDAMSWRGVLAATHETASATRTIVRIAPKPAPRLAPNTIASPWDAETTQSFAAAFLGTNEVDATRAATPAALAETAPAPLTWPILLDTYVCGASHGAIVELADGRHVSGLVKGLAKTEGYAARRALALAALAPE